MASNRGVKVTSFVSHTLFDHKEILKQGGGKAPLTYASFIKIVDKLKVPEPVATPASLPSIDNSLLSGMETSVPNWQEVGFTSPPTTPFKGGEDEGLRRMEEKLQNKQWIASFEKPNTDPSAFLVPSTTCLSAYLKFGCLSSRLFHSRLVQVYRESKGHSQPPVSLRGQLLWREFFYCVGAATGPSFSRMEGNPICRQIEWDENEDHLQLWKEGKTGYPWIDAIMRQLKEWGWCHHLARHSVACFLTRGDLYLSWEKGLAHFEEHLIDQVREYKSTLDPQADCPHVSHQDHYINSGNWMWLSASAFFNQYWKVYSPVAFGKKYDPSGAFIRRFVPELARFPDKYIYEPHTAPLAVQKAASCIIGEDYPKPMVDHSVVSKSCISRMAAAYKLSRGEVGDEDQAATAGKGKGKREAAPTSKASSSKKNQKTLEESGFVTSKKKD